MRPESPGPRSPGAAPRGLGGALRGLLQGAPWALLVTRKELTDGLRDRQTLAYVVLLPLCLYPVLFWLMVQGALLVQGRREHTEVRVALATAAGVEAPASLEEALARPRGTSPLPAPAVAARVERLEVRRIPPPVDPEDASSWGVEDGERADALLLLSPATPGAAPARLYHDSTRTRSKIARRRVEERVADFAAELRDAAARERGLEPEELAPFSLEERGLDEERDLGAYVLSFILPLMLVVATVLGAFMPAVDLTAGEHERGTAETTMLLPVPRMSVYLGKVLAVCLSGLLATLLNLFALGLSAEHLLRMQGIDRALRIELPLGALMLVLPLALLFSFTVSAVLCGLASLARSFKEGQAMLGPVQMVFVLPAMAGMIPGLELSPRLALVPVVNVVLAFRTLIRGEAPLLELSLVALSLLVLAIASVWLCVRLLSRESVLLSTRTLSIRRLFSLLSSAPAQR